MGLSKGITNDSDATFNLSSPTRIEISKTKGKNKFISIEPKVLSDREIDSKRIKSYKFAF